MATERTYTIPLRREWLKNVKYKRAKKAVRAIREFLSRHMKVGMANVKIEKYLNLELWKHSIKNPPSRVKVNVTKDDKGVVRAELFGAPKEEKVEALKKPAAKKEAVPEKKPAPAKSEAKPAEKKPAAPKPVAPKPAAPAPAPAPQKQIGQIIR
jgi:large subunit ribosomal protein L31e